jgi:hypothetical protein
VLAVTAITQAAATAAPSFTGRGSVEQVYVTGLAASAQMSLVNSAGTTLQIRQANSRGGLLFRDLPPGAG